MSDLVGNPEDRFSDVAAHILAVMNKTDDQTVQRQRLICRLICIFLPFLQIRNVVYVLKRNKIIYKIESKKIAFSLLTTCTPQSNTVKPVLSDHIKPGTFLAFQTGGCLLLHESSAESFHAAISNHLSVVSPEWIVA